jgi:hypothetical protein
VEDFPLGYPRQAAFVSSKPTLSIYRAFNYLHARVILELQDELRCLEQDLADLDAEYFYSSDPRQNARVTSRDADMLEARRESKKAENQGNGALPGALNYEQSSVPLTKRAALLVAIRLKLVEYDEMLVKVRELSEFKRPSRRDYLTFRTWFWNIKPLSYEAEEEYIRKEGDLITTLSPRAEWGSLDGWIEELIPKLPHLARRVRIFPIALFICSLLSLFTRFFATPIPVEPRATHSYLTIRFLASRSSPPSSYLSSLSSCWRYLYS